MNRLARREVGGAPSGGRNVALDKRRRQARGVRPLCGDPCSARVGQLRKSRASNAVYRVMFRTELSEPSSTAARKTHSSSGRRVAAYIPLQASREARLSWCGMRKRSARNHSPA